MKASQKSLFLFLRTECANWDNYYKLCQWGDEKCRVMEGKRCGYFEKAVLGPHDYKYRLPGYDYVKLFAEYAEQTHAQTKKVKQRRCECGEPLSHRQRYCESCRRIRAKTANRERQQKHRTSDSLNVTV